MGILKPLTIYVRTHVRTYARPHLCTTTYGLIDSFKHKQQQLMVSKLSFIFHEVIIQPSINLIYCYISYIIFIYIVCYILENRRKKYKYKYFQYIRRNIIYFDTLQNFFVLYYRLNLYIYIYIAHLFNDRTYVSAERIIMCIINSFK